MNATRCGCLLPCLLVFLTPCLTPSVRAQEKNTWEGEWVTDQGPMVLEQSGDRVKGTYGKGGSVEGRIEDGSLELTYRMGRASGSLNVKMADDGQTFDGKWKSGRGSGAWRGWRKDPAGDRGPAADFSGYWMTTWGPMRVEQTGDRVSGTYAAHGWSSFQGTVSGRRLKLEWEKLSWKGQAWLEQTADGRQFFGMTTDTRDPSTWLGIRVPDHQHHVRPAAGKIVKGYADNGMMYHLRMPDGWQEGEQVDVIVLLHGSNWTTAGMVFIAPENWPELGRKYAILGIQGERWVKWSDAESPRFNYTYVNWMGRSTYQGYPHTDRESPYLVMNVIGELDALHDFGRVFVGGHSQGAYLTYLLHMHFPEKLDGTFPLAGGLVMQAEPDVFDDEDLVAAQKATPMAIVHGKRDNVVAHSVGVYNYHRFVAYDFPLVTLLQPDSGHPYDFLPVDEAVEYLDMMSTRDVGALARYGEEMVRQKRWREVGNVIARAKEIEGGKDFSPVYQAYETAAEQDADRLRRDILANRNARWVGKFLKWQEKFGRSTAGQATVAAYRALQRKHDEPANELMKQARKAFRSGNAREGYAKYQQIVDEYPAAKVCRQVKNSLDNR